MSALSAEAVQAGRSRPAIGGRLATLGLLVALLIALLLAVPGLADVLDAIRGINPVWIVAAVGLELASELSFVVVFRLFFDRLGAGDARALAWTELGTGALLPGGGAGGLAIGAWLIHRLGAPTNWVLRRSGGLFFLTSAVNAATLVLAGLALWVGGSAGPHGFVLTALPALLVLVVAVTLAALPFFVLARPGAPRWVRAVGIAVRDAEQTTFHRPSWRLLGAVGYQVFDIAVLWLALRALGPDVGVPAVVLAYTIGYLANALPIPGGIGILDAGLSGALMLYGVAPAHAAAAVLVYHAVALWVPGVGGLVAYSRLRGRVARSPSDAPMLEG